MTKAQKDRVKQASRELYQAERISLKMAAWAMKNAGYTREKTAEWLELKRETIKRSNYDRITEIRA
jgi:hypothetical protein